MGVWFGDPNNSKSPSRVHMAKGVTDVSFRSSLLSTIHSPLLIPTWPFL